MTATWLDTLGRLSPASPAWALASRPGNKWLDAGMAELRIRELGPRDAPAFVFAADAPIGIEHYDRLLERWPRQLRAVVVEMPGFGFSRARPGFDFTLAAYAAVAERALETLECKRPTLVFGCAWGFVALELVHRRRLSVERLILPQTPSWDAMQRWNDRVDPRRILRVPVVGQLLVRARRRTIARGWYRAAYPDRAFGAALDATSTEVFAHGCSYALASLMQGFARSRAPRPIEMPPATLLWGAADRTHRKTPAESARELVPHGELIVLDRAGHSPELEAPERLIELLRAPP